MKSLKIGITGIASSIITTPLLTTGPDDQIINVIVQILIGVATLIGLFRRKNK
jgi:hypothetical protein